MLRKDLKCSFRLKDAVWVVEDRMAMALLISRWVSVYLWIFFCNMEVFVEDGTGKGRRLQLGCLLVGKREQAVWSAVIRA